jgi:uncharacterized membrane protein
MAGPISMFVPAALIAVLCLPLALKWVPPNRFYGIRTAQTLASREVWFRVNRVAGFALLVAAAISMCAYLLEPELASGRSFLGVLILIVPVIVALAVTATYARKLARGSADG